ncbi:hypothetical protein SAY86_009765 [Trapa natans]|uniref:Fe2OG dioxygenase domain-containing protein n=1 Tax=Trapa natans TaxID=22666 RepID=A0AAN7QTA1_TRANT|nr:hypothetical protein SAY86_009765 [Trapa natans]
MEMEMEKSVQALASATLLSGTLPAEFIRPLAEQPTATTRHYGPVSMIPTVDLSETDQEKLVQAISEACGTWGTFQLVNHGIPPEAINRLQSVGREFFELSSPKEKEECSDKATAGGSRSVGGYGRQVREDADGKKVWSDHLFHKIWPPSSINYQFWPKNPPSYREANEEYAVYLREASDKVLKLMSLGLGLEENALGEALGGEQLQYNLKINYYPPCPRPDLVLGLVAHRDLSAITVLVPNEVPGLQVLKDDQWIEVEYIPNSLIVHVGDQIEILSNGKYRSVLHRVTVKKDRLRMSWPVFLEPPAELVVGPLPQLINDQDPAKYKPQKFKDYMFSKLNKLPE